VLRADGLVYQDVDDLLAVGYELNPNIKVWDAACFDGHYVTGAASRHLAFGSRQRCAAWVRITTCADVQYGTGRCFE
jgi:glutamine phosphoribosylpyrophosphate amidotransferase